MDQPASQACFLGKIGKSLKSPLWIGEILSKILSYLDVSELKKARQVSKFWKNHADDYYYKIASIRFDSSKKEIENPPLYLLPRVLVNLNDFEVCSRHSRHLVRLFQTCSDNLKTLNLHLGNYEYELGKVWIIKNILKHVKNVETLRLDIVVPYRERMWLKNEEFALPSLKRLEFVQLDGFHDFDNVHHLDRATVLMWTKQFFRLVPNVTTLMFHETLEITMDSCSSLLCEDVYEEMFLPKLECIEMTKALCPLTLMLSTLDKIQLKKINFGVIQFVIPRMYDIQKVLAKHSETLEYVRMEIGIRECEPEDPFEMPFLPRLKSLSVYWYQRSYSETSRFDVLNLNELFKSSQELPRKLPRLEDLRVTCGYDVDSRLETAYNEIFPETEKNAATFPQIKVIHVTYPKGIDKHRKLAHRLGKLFPGVINNAHFKWAAHNLD